jgi:hypothetical protein
MSTTSSRRDNLTQTTKDGKIELTEQELNRATGGFLKISMKNSTISSLTAKSS